MICLKFIACSLYFCSFHVNVFFFFLYETKKKINCVKLNIHTYMYRHNAHTSKVMENFVWYGTTHTYEVRWRYAWKSYYIWCNKFKRFFFFAKYFSFGSTCVCSTKIYECSLIKAVIGMIGNLIQWSLETHSPCFTHFFSIFTFCLKNTHNKHVPRVA